MDKRSGAAMTPQEVRVVKVAGLEIRSIAESRERWLAEDQERMRELRDGFTLGEWEFVPRTLVLRHAKPFYEVDLERCATSSSALDWVVQVATKTWATEATVGSLVKAMHKVIGLRSLCGGAISSGGMDREPINVAERVRARATTPETFI